jgi:hypothetical protein
LWSERILDHFTSLSIGNRLGMRSLADYTQYHGFPSVIGHYAAARIDEAAPEALRDLALPMGQIGRKRAHRFDTIFEDSGSRYFYGTHYLHLGVVLHVILRPDPFCRFSLQLPRG